MAKDDLTQNTTIQLSAGHLLVVWDVLANKITESGFIEALTEEERRAIWAIEDMFERSLTDAGISGRPAAEWEVLMEAAREYVKTIPTEYLD